MITSTEKEWFRRFHGNTGGRVGRAAAYALTLARAMARGEDDDSVEFVWEEDATADFSWCDARQIAELRAGTTEILCLLLRIDGVTVDCLGGIHVYAMGAESRAYRRQCEAEMLAEYYHGVDAVNSRILAHVESVVQGVFP